MVELGWTGVDIAEDFGGSALGFQGLGLILEQLGGSLAVSRFCPPLLLVVRPCHWVAVMHKSLHGFQRLSKAAPCLRSLWMKGRTTTGQHFFEGRERQAVVTSSLAPSRL